MKQLWCSVALILILISSALLNVQYLKHFVSFLSDSLTSAQECAQAGDYKQAQVLTSAAQQHFESHAFYLHITLAHQDIDLIEYTFRDVLSYLSLGETGALYASSNTYLLAQLQLLVESEQLNLKNVL